MRFKAISLPYNKTTRQKRGRIRSCFLLKKKMLWQNSSEKKINTLFDKLQLKNKEKKTHEVFHQGREKWIAPTQNPKFRARFTLFFFLPISHTHTQTIFSQFIVGPQCWTSSIADFVHHFVAKLPYSPYSHDSLSSLSQLAPVLLPLDTG